MSQHQNKNVWNQDAYDAWLNKYGSPEDYADKIAKNPSKHLGSLIPFFQEISGLKILNLMGSNGSKAVALTLLGGDVTLVDFSEENKKYALEMCEHLGITINFIVQDVLTLDLPSLKGSFDLVFAEMGILHYFSDLDPFFNLYKTYLKPGGLGIIRDFHPVSTKLIVSRGSTAKVRKHKVEGDYFDTSLKVQSSALEKYKANSQDDDLVYLRHWNLGEIISSIGHNGLFISDMVEEPNLSSDVFDKGIPKTFLIAARKI